MDVVASGNQKTPGRVTDGIVEREHYPNYEGVDFHHHFCKDIRLLAEMGLRCFRIGTAWTRIFPDGNEEEPNEKGLRFYDGVFGECLKCGVESVVTLSCFGMPFHLAGAYDVWGNRKLIDSFVQFAAVYSEWYRGEMKYWTTFNEINSQANYWSLFGLYTDSGILCGDGEDAEAPMHQAAHYELTASARATKLGYEIDPNFQVGYTIAMCPVYLASCRPEDVLMAEKAVQRRYYYMGVHVKGEYPPNILRYWEWKGMAPDVTEEDMADLKRGTADYIGLSYYMPLCTRYREEGAWLDYNEARDLVMNPYMEVSDWGWQIDSVELWYATDWFTDRYDVPLFIVEGRLGVYDEMEEGSPIQDNYWTEYLKIHIGQMKKAVEEDGADLLGYTPWGCIDLVSAGTGELDK